jgi:hypothetical protein
MNRLHSSLASLGFVVAAASASAQFYPPPPPAYPGMTNFNLRAANPYMNQWDVGLNIRGRFENKDNASFSSGNQNADFRGGGSTDLTDNNNTYSLMRVMPRIGYTDKWYQVFVQGRSSASFDDERGNNGTTNTNAATPGVLAGKGEQENNRDLSIHQAYVAVGNHKEYPVSAKVGRQELIYGDQRQIGNFLWNNNGRSFDAGKVRYQNSMGGVDLFTGSVVYHDNGAFDKSHYDNDKFSGAYFNLTTIPVVSKNHIVETYLLNRNVEAGSLDEDWGGIAAPFRNPPIQDLYTVGLRVKSKPNTSNPWDYSGEGMYQFGTINNRNATTGAAVTVVNNAAAHRSARELDQDAYSAIGQIGYTWYDLAWQPRLSLMYSYASGDKNAKDGESNTFQNQFATTHFFYGYSDLNSLQNLHDLRLALEAKPTPKLRVAIEGHLQRLDTTNDYWYNVGGVARVGGNQTINPDGSGFTTANNNGSYGINSSFSNSLGKEVDLIISYTPVPYLNIEANVSHYFHGDYIKQTWANNGGSDDANYAYIQVTLNL